MKLFFSGDLRDGLAPRGLRATNSFTLNMAELNTLLES